MNSKKVRAEAVRRSRPLIAFSLLGLASVLAVSFQDRESGWIDLMGDRLEPGRVRLRWEPRTWPEGIDGFSVRRRPLSAEGKVSGPWERVSTKPILPGFAKNADLSVIEPDAAARAKLSEKRDRLVKEKQILEGEGDIVRAQLRKADSGFAQALRMFFKDDPDIALLLGFGIVDRGIRPGVLYEYGLFPVERGGVENDAPVASYSEGLGQGAVAFPPIADLAANREGSWIQLQWSVPTETLLKHSVRSFNVYRAPGTGEAFVRLGQNALPPKSLTKERGTWSILDQGADPEKPWTYAIAACDATGRELSGRTIHSFVGDIPSPRLLPPESLPGGSGVKLSWEFPREKESLISGFQVERLVYPAEKFGEPSPVIPSGDRKYESPLPVKSGTGHFYRLLALRGGQPAKMSNAEFLLVLGAPPPPAPTGLKAEIVEAVGGKGIRLVWDPPAAGDRLTRGYLLYADDPKPGQVLPQASVPLITAHETVFVPGLLDGRTMTVGIAAAGAAGQVSEVVSVRIAVPGTRVPMPTGATLTRPGKNTGPLVLTWSYEAGDSLLGFRVSEGSSVMADENVLKAPAREFRIDKPREKSIYDVELRAILKDGTLSAPARVSYSPMLGDTSGRPAMASNLTAVWSDRDGKPEITLRWDAFRGEVPKELRVLWDRSSFGSFERLESPRFTGAGECTWPVEDSKRSYSIRLIAVSNHDKEGIPAQALLIGKGRSLPPPLLSSYEFVKSPEGVRAVLRWKYEGKPALKGFTMFQDGAPVSGPVPLPAETREWTSAPLRRAQEYVFRLGVVEDGVELELGSTLKVRHFLR